jgi:hypothetical protein
MTRPRPVKVSLVIGAGLAVALLLAFLVSPEASGEPDGLNKVAIDQGSADQEQAHAWRTVRSPATASKASTTNA